MYVKVVKTSRETYWYASEIGKWFEVLGVEGDVYAVRKWKETVSVLDFDVAPILKCDCEEHFIKKKYGEKTDKAKWLERKEQLTERSAFRTKQEVEMYELLNKQVEIKVIKTKEEER